MGFIKIIWMVLFWRELAGVLLALAAVKLCREEDSRKAASPLGTCGSEGYRYNFGEEKRKPDG